MRENMGLYHGKREDNGEWVEGYYCNCIRVLNGEKTYPAIQQTDDNSLYFRKVIPETVGQFTGKYDKNRKKIFEWDIVKIGTYTGNLKSEYGVVKYDSKEATFFVKYSNCETYFCADDEDEIEVIGNIYDNPELLKGA